MKTILMYAAQCSTPAMVAMLIERNADPLAADQYGRTALHLACKAGKLDTVTTLTNYAVNLIQSKQDVSLGTDMLTAISNSGQSILMSACEGGCKEIVH